MKLLANFIRLVPVLLLCALGCAAALIGLRRLDAWCQVQCGMRNAECENEFRAAVVAVCQDLPTDIQRTANRPGSDVSAPARTPEGNGTATHNIATSGEIRTGQSFVGDEVTRLRSKTSQSLLTSSPTFRHGHILRRMS